MIVKASKLYQTAEAGSGLQELQVYNIGRSRDDVLEFEPKLRPTITLARQM